MRWDMVGQGGGGKDAQQLASRLAGTHHSLGVEKTQAFSTGGKRQVVRQGLMEHRECRRAGGQAGSCPQPVAFVVAFTTHVVAAWYACSACSCTSAASVTSSRGLGRAAWLALMAAEAAV